MPTNGVSREEYWEISWFGEENTSRLSTVALKWLERDGYERGKYQFVLSESPYEKWEFNGEYYYAHHLIVVKGLERYDGTDVVFQFYPWRFDLVEPESYYMRWNEEVTELRLVVVYKTIITMQDDFTQLYIQTIIP